MGKNISTTRKLLQEKFGFTKSLSDNIQDLHKDVVDRQKENNDKKKDFNPAYLPIEEFRSQIKLLMGHLEDNEKSIQDHIDFEKLKKLMTKTGIDHLIPNVEEIEKEVNKKSPEFDVIKYQWKYITDNLPYWFLGMTGKKQQELTDEDKSEITNLLDIMKKYNKESEKEGKDAAKDTPKSKSKTEAEKNISKAKKSSDYKEPKADKVKPSK